MLIYIKKMFRCKAKPLNFYEIIMNTIKKKLYHILKNLIFDKKI